MPEAPVVSEDVQTERTEMPDLRSLQAVDPEIFQAIEDERERQNPGSS